MPSDKKMYPCVGGCGRETSFEPCEVCGNSTCQDCGPCLPYVEDINGVKYKSYGCIQPGNGFKRIDGRPWN